jgi:poly-gamma-glutamate capsule biosynthesis protein CapA/YwtB (metallophosphatase superfamily)
MPSPPATRPRDLWLSLFVTSIVALTAAMVVLALVLLDLVSDGKTRAQEPGLGPTASNDATPEPVPTGLTYSGPLPAAAEALGMTATSAGRADITFAASGGPESVATRYFVPVVSIGAGIDSLTLAQLKAIFRGETKDWQAVGGIAGPIHPIFAITDSRAFLSGFENNGAVEWVPAELQVRQMMSVDSGVIAIVPLDALKPWMVAVSIDGVDIARGIGDAAAWPLVEKDLLVTANSGRGRDALDSVRAAVTAKLPVITRVVATGDILQSRCSLAAIEATGDWAAALRGPVAEYLAAADLALGSLDGSIQDIGTPDLCVPQDYPNLTSPPQVIEALTLAGFDEMTLATNHAFDCGSAGCGSKALLQSQSRLNAVGIKTVGGGKDLGDALAPAIFEVHGLKIGVLGFDDIAAEDLEATDTSPGTAPLDDSYSDEHSTPPQEPAFYKPASLLELDRFTQRIKDLKKQVDIVIVQVQSGTEDTHTPSPRSIKALRAAADAGADLVVGNQAHWVQAVEVRDDAFVAYALGNFIFDQVHTPEHTQGYLLEATFHDAKLATVRLVPYQIENRYKPTFVSGTTRNKVIGDVVDASVDLPAP